MPRGEDVPRDARALTEDITLFSLPEPGSVPSRQPWKIGALRCVMHVIFMVGRGVGISETTR